MQNHLKNELHDVISGKSQVSHGATIQAAAGYLGNGFKASSIFKGAKQGKEQERTAIQVLTIEIDC